MNPSIVQTQLLQTSATGNSQYITFIYQQGHKKQKIDRRIVPFSQLLRNMLQHIQQTNQEPLREIKFEQFLQIDDKVIQLIKLFHEMHNYDESEIRISKIKTTGWFNALDPISLKFAENHLELQTEDVIKRLLNLCEFLKLNLLKQVICAFIASKHYNCYNDVKMQKNLQDLNVFYSRQMEIDLKRYMLNYARQLSKDLYEKIQLRHQRRQTNVQ